MILDISHNATMIHGAVTSLNLDLFARGMFIDRLQVAADRGMLIAPDGAIARQLADDVKTLRFLALQLEQRRAALIDNATPRFQSIPSPRANAR
jgi:hypothetical protein